jgi:hypothetical protein
MDIEKLWNDTDKHLLEANYQKNCERGLAQGRHKMPLKDYFNGNDGTTNEF